MSEWERVWEVLKGVAALGGIASIAGLAYAIDQDVDLRRKGELQQDREARVFDELRSSGFDGLKMAELVERLSGAPEFAGAEAAELRSRAQRTLVRLMTSEVVVVNNDDTYSLKVYPKQFIEADLQQALVEQYSSYVFQLVRENPGVYSAASLQDKLVEEFGIQPFFAYRIVMSLADPGQPDPILVSNDSKDEVPRFSDARLEVFE